MGGADKSNKNMFSECGVWLCCILTIAYITRIAKRTTMQGGLQLHRTFYDNPGRM